ncbi:hypothetical protein VSO92_05455 [Myroides pelagicus]|uniref:hypothetical protein n=1 Tax=Myroides pelagicus TaxID=270914 RepID=UPI002DBE0F41|nr:hypothetical protein [Myroides pelagicus]MEC4113553.1 hypothetical protein [Myroides pelagicus]
MISSYRIISCRYFFFNDFDGITIYPFIILKNKESRNNTTLIQHECIHLRQQLELLILPFYIWYITEFLLHWMMKRNARLAYKSISFEREAYTHENTIDYLANRKTYSFLKHL